MFIPLDTGDAHILFKMRSSDTIELVSTVVSPEFRGKPYAKELAVFAFDYVRKNHLKVIVTCPYLKVFIDKNKEKHKEPEIVK